MQNRIYKFKKDEHYLVVASALSLAGILEHIPYGYQLFTITKINDDGKRQQEKNRDHSRCL